MVPKIRSIWEHLDTAITFGSFTVFAVSLSFQWQNGAKLRKQVVSKCFQMLENSENSTK
jgi:hypothetical protein